MEIIENLKNYDNHEWRLLDKYAFYLDRKDVLHQVQIGEVIKESIFTLYKDRTNLVEQARKEAEKELKALHHKLN